MKFDSTDLQNLSRDLVIHCLNLDPAMSQLTTAKQNDAQSSYTNFTYKGSWFRSKRCNRCDQERTSGDPSQDSRDLSCESSVWSDVWLML